jgi:predicted glycoside hydrolase/deacetylase ChbG (UPF0249 family)
MKLIVNADDLGFSRGVNFGIIDAYENGVVRSSTIMANMPEFAHAVKLCREHPGLGVGVHLTLTTGVPLLPGHRSIIADDGHFHNQSFIMENSGTLDFDEVEREFEAQVEMLISAEIQPTHIDGHHHVHSFNGIAEVTARICKKYGLSVRGAGKGDIWEKNGIVTTSCFSAEFYGEGATFDNLISIIELNSGAESLEIMTHPAFLDLRLHESASYDFNRVNEQAILTSSRLKEYLRREGVTLCGFADL